MPQEGSNGPCDMFQWKGQTRKEDAQINKLDREATL